MYLSTFSITARCAETGMLGVAMCTAIPAIGGLAIRAQAGVGAIATQAKLNPYLGIIGLEQLAKGGTADAVLQMLAAVDPLFNTRQIAIVDAKGNAIAHTGKACFAWCGQVCGAGFVIVANMMQDASTVAEMEQVFLAETSLSLPERLLRALMAGDATGGDYRGRQSACLYVVHQESYPYLDLRVDEHQTPVMELQRIFAVWQRQLLPLMAMLPTRENPAGKLPTGEHPYFIMMRKPVAER
ncbi:DUF1028 domain-containing protein [Beggiatoa leptomitoformis]|uniref:DUF1028 domain-containing protein n=1 Tax=Beggiatoa leptomitoformis TaxID=288004 RepID=A0A2N9YD42_9GAMM|nr:DUF1028 domain-containing protein [Beggiatoa leptomitoformis]ALG69194.1 DUF1028 domain-containing protein [Beggiatoa leptomitoformis]AUI68377.1 DUF1028 domain-containing protein [Beggiatoa leptomitoformis]